MFQDVHDVEEKKEEEDVMMFDRVRWSLALV